MSEVEDRSHLYRVNPFARVQYNNYVNSTPPKIKDTDSFLQKVDDNVYEFRKPKGKDEYIPIITVSPSEINLISQTSSSVNISSEETTESNIISSVENEININEEIPENFIETHSQYPLLLAARLAFNDFKEKRKRIQVLKLLFKQKLDKKKSDTPSTAPNTTDSESVDELLKTQDNDKNNVLHLLVKGFDKNAVVEPDRSTPSIIYIEKNEDNEDEDIEENEDNEDIEEIKDNEEIEEIEDNEDIQHYIAEVTQFRDTLRDLMHIHSVTPNNNPIIDNALQRIVNASSRKNITALNEKNSNGDTPYDLFLDHYSSTPLQTRNKSALGLSQISVEIIEMENLQEGVLTLTNDQQNQLLNDSQQNELDKLDKVYEEIIDLLKPNEKSKPSPRRDDQLSPIQRKMYYAYGDANQIKTTTNYNAITLINPTYHEFIKITKRLHSIPQHKHYDLTSHNGEYDDDTFDVSKILKDIDITPYKQCAIGFYIEEGIEEPPIILDLFLYNTNPTTE
jgi:hypothetical protein